MKCTKLRRLLADRGPAALAGNQEAEDHLVDCSRCYAVLEAITEIDQLLPELESHDVADKVVEQLLGHSELREKTESGSSTRVGRLASLRARFNALSPSLTILESFRWLGSSFDRARQARLRWGIVAVPAVLLIGIVSVLTMRSFDGPQRSIAPYVVKQVKFKEKPGEAEERAVVDMIGESDREAGHAAGFGGEAGADRDDDRAVVFSPMKGEIRKKEDRAPEDGRAPRPMQRRVPLPDPVVVEEIAPPPPAESNRPVLAYPSVADSPRPAEEEGGRSRVEEKKISDETIEQAMERSFEGDVTVTGSLIPKADLSAVLTPVDPHSEKAAAGLQSLDLNELPTGGLNNQKNPSSSDDDLSSVSKTQEQDDEARMRRLNQSPGLETKRDHGRQQAQATNLEHRAGNEEFRRKIAALEQQAQEFRDLGDVESAKQIEARFEVLKTQYENVSGKNYVGGTGDGVEGRESPLSSLVSRQAAIDVGATASARRFLDARNRVEDLNFREARGYWANTYVPGDRTLRQLKARLDRMAGTGTIGNLHAGSRQISQPFDPPDSAALAVYLHGDRTGVETRERMLVQVGLKGTSRRSGIRPAMTVGLVLDFRGEVEPAAAASIRALLQAFAASAELGDRFSLTVAGRSGGTIVAPGDLRHGPLTVAMAELFGDKPSGAVLSLDQAVATAQSVVRVDDDPNAPLGSSALIIITAQRLGGFTGRLAATAHQSAVDGVPWSVIGIGRGVDLAELDALVLAGQGNRRLLTSAADAESLVDRELAAVSRVVARAVRLRIRLAPGVQLVDVIGSERLDERRSQQVRDAEQAVDQRLSSNLGIQADRGLDEDGIQIVIPSFYADNAHVVLLDLVVPGPGPVADVTVRYKDVVHMRNGVARAHLRVGRSESDAGPLERNVLANLVATEVASRLDAAADAVAAGNVTAAQAILDDILSLVRGITSLVEGLGQNPDLEADMEMLSGYIEALSTVQANDPDQLQTAADSLRYAGRLKVLPPPVNDDQID